MSGLIYEGHSSGKDVQDLIDTRLMPALQGVDLDLAVGAMCCMIMQQMCPTLTPDQLYEGVRSIRGGFARIWQGWTRRMSPWW